MGMGMRSPPSSDKRRQGRAEQGRAGICFLNPGELAPSLRRSHFTGEAGLNGRVGGREGKKTRERFLAASLTEGTCRARACNLRGKGLALHPLDHRVGCKRTEGGGGNQTSPPPLLPEKNKPSHQRKKKGSRRGVAAKLERMGMGMGMGTGAG